MSTVNLIFAAYAALGIAAAGIWLTGVIQRGGKW
jgi:hypothetical protein